MYISSIFKWSRITTHISGFSNLLAIKSFEMTTLVLQNPDGSEQLVLLTNEAYPPEAECDLEPSKDVDTCSVWAALAMPL
jgi:hypothetical protein